MSDCALMMDGMAVRKQVLYNTKNMKYSGLWTVVGLLLKVVKIKPQRLLFS